MNRKKVCLVLGSGGARGIADIGVIKCLLENNIPIDLIAGSSSGALFGGLYAALGDIERVERLVVDFGLKDWFEVFGDMAIGNGIIKGNRAEEYLRRILGDEMIENLKIPFVAVATDLFSAEAVEIKSGDLVKGIRASGSLPMVFEPVKIGERLLVDGGLSWPVPVECAKELGAGITVAVNLDSVYFSPRNMKRVDKISQMGVLTNSFFLLKHHLAEKELRGTDIVINPDIPYVMDLAFVGQEKIIDGGVKSTQEKIGEIKKLLG